jgi:hypothetical protein
MGKLYKQVNIGTVNFLRPIKERMEHIKTFKHVKSVESVHGIATKITYKGKWYFHEYRMNKDNRLLYDLIIRKPK